MKRKLAAIILACCMVCSSAGVSVQANEVLDNGAVSLLNVNEAANNLALGKTALASSNEGTTGRFEDAAVDGDSNTRWASRVGKNGSGIDETWYYVDLGMETEVSKVVISWESRPNKFKIQTSVDGNNWTDAGDVVDNGEQGSGSSKKVNTVEFDTVTARYVKMQGIERRKAELDGNTGYSIYEFEVYGPSWSDDKYVDSYMSTLTMPARVSRDFTLPTKNDEYGVTISYTTDNNAITIGADGVAKVTKTEEVQQVNVTAKVKRGDIEKEKTFTITVSSSQTGDYNIYPVPANMNAKDGVVSLDEVNLVLEDTVNQYTQQHAEEILKDAGIPYEITEEVSEDKTNMIIGIADGEGVADSYFEDVEYDAANSSDKSEGYVLDVDSEKNTIAILGHENTGSSYGLATLDQMIDQSDSNLKSVMVEDAPETTFRGFIEGFYGTPWSHENRKSLMEFCGDYKMNTYIYGPKNDPYHAAQWRDFYPEDKLNELAELVEVGKQTNVEFVWAIHVGGRIDLGSEEDIQQVKYKFDQMYSIGVRQFAVFFDDSSTNNTQLVNFMNDLQQNYVEAKGDVKPLVFCPQYYNKKNGNESYLRNLRNFDEDIQIMWTGDFVVSEINQSVIDYIVDLIQRPVYIWWNYPVNDLGRAHLLHMGPTEALAPNIKDMGGFVSNPMNQAQCNKVSLFSIADYTWNSTQYDSQKSWEDSWERIITDDEAALEAFKIFVQNCAAAPMSFGYTDESTYLIPYFEDFKAKLYAEEDFSAEANALAEKFAEIKNSIEVLRAYTGTNNISSEMRLWMDVMYDIADAGEYVMRESQNLEPVTKDNDDSIYAMMNFISEGRAKLAKSNNGHGGKKCAQKRLYPFVESVLQDFEDTLSPALELPSTHKGFGSSKVEYAAMLDGYSNTYVELGSQAIDSYFGVDLGKIQEVKDIHIEMSEKDAKNVDAYYKQGVVEYSVDQKNWTRLADFAAPVIDIEDAGVEARFIRYRATEIFEDITTGINTSNVQVKEMSVNSEIAAVAYSNADAFAGTQVAHEGNEYILANNQELTLKSGEYAGIEFSVVKGLFGFENHSDLDTEVSMNGKDWETVENAADFKWARFVRVCNKTEEDVTLPVNVLRVKNGGSINVESAVQELNGRRVYSGNVSDTIDGNRDTALWLYSGGTGGYLEYTFSEVVRLNSMNIYCAGDILDVAHIDISEDGETWETAHTITSAGNENNIQLYGIPTKKLRIYIDDTAWVKINEVKFDVTEDMKVLSGRIQGYAQCGSSSFVANGRGIWEGSIESTIDGNRSSKLWLKSGSIDPAPYLEYTFKEKVILSAINIYCERDILKKAHIDVSADGQNWETVHSFELTDEENQIPNENQILLEDIPAKSVRIYIEDSAWLTFNEIQFEAISEGNTERAVDGNVFTAYSSSKGGELIYNNINRKDEDTFVVLKNKDTVVKVDAKVDGEWKAYGEYTNMYNEISYSEEVEEFRISWDAGETIEIYEVLMKKSAEATEPEETDKEDLAALIEYAKEAQKAESYAYLVPKVKALFEKALDEAAAVDEDIYATQEEVDAAYELLLGRVHLLDFTGNPEDLKNLVALSEKLLEAEAEYTKESWVPFAEALAEAQELLKDVNALDADLKTAHAKLDAAKKALKKIPVDKTKLAKLVEKAGTYEENINNYVASTTESFTAALADARTVLNNAEAIQAQVESAYTALLRGIFELREKPNKDKLEVLLNKVEAMDLSVYSAEIASAVKAAYAEAAAVFEDENADQKEVDAAVVALEEAVKAANAETGIKGEENTSGNGSASDDTSKSDYKVASDNTGSKTTNKTAGNTAAKTGDSANAAMPAAAGLAAIAAVIKAWRKRNA